MYRELATPRHCTKQQCKIPLVIRTCIYKILQILNIQEAPTSTPRNRLVQISDHSERCQLQKMLCAWSHYSLLFCFACVQSAPPPDVDGLGPMLPGSAWGLETHHTRCASRRDGALREYRQGQRRTELSSCVLASCAIYNAHCGRSVRENNASTALQVAARALYAHICAPPR